MPVTAVTRTGWRRARSWGRFRKRGYASSLPAEVNHDPEIAIEGERNPASLCLGRANLANAHARVSPVHLSMAVQVGSTTARKLLMLASALVQRSRVSVLRAVAIICST